MLAQERYAGLPRLGGLPGEVAVRVLVVDEGVPSRVKAKVGSAAGLLLDLIGVLWFDAVDGALPAQRWTAPAVEAVLASIERRARLLTPCPVPSLRTIPEMVADKADAFTVWGDLLAGRPRDRNRVLPGARGHTLDGRRRLRRVGRTHHHDPPAGADLSRGS